MKIEKTFGKSRTAKWRRWLSGRDLLNSGPVDDGDAESRLSDNPVNSRFLPGLPMPGRLSAPPAYLLRLALTRSRISGVRISSIANPILPPGTTIVFGRDMNE